LKPADKNWTEDAMSAENPNAGAMTDEMSAGSPEEQRSLDLVQRTVISILVVFVMGLLAAALALYIVVAGASMARGDVIGLWLMTGVLGLVTADAVLLINRRKAYHPLVLLGLVPMAACWFAIF
jgi:hypothetical protein